MKRIVLLFAFPLLACDMGTPVSVHNSRTTAMVVFVSFGADSKITADDWSFCAGSGLNVTLSFDGQGCGATKAEVQVNNESWYDITDVSLVDGYSNNIEISSGGTVIAGPPNGETGNEKVYGLYPYGCDICVERQNPPCGISKGKDGCKTGGQYNPDVPCQWQGAKKGGGGGPIVVSLL